MTGKAQQQELEVAGYTASTVRKQREAETGTSSLSPFYSVQDPGTCDGATHIQDGSSHLS